jgi:hypothetical protein
MPGLQSDDSEHAISPAHIVLWQIISAEKGEKVKSFAWPRAFAKLFFFIFFLLFLF